MALDLGLTTHQLLSTPDGVVSNARIRGQRLDDAVEQALDVPADEAAFRTAAVGRRPYISARTGPEGLLGSRSLPEVPQDWVALLVDGSHIGRGPPPAPGLPSHQPARLRHHLRDGLRRPAVQRARPARGGRRPVPPVSGRRSQ